MKKGSQIVTLFLGILICSHLVSNVALAQVETSVYEIQQDPAVYLNENVKVTGLVIQYVPSTSNTLAYYILRDDNGAEIQVNTAFGEPVTNEKYIVTGILYSEFRQLFISELDRTPLVPETPAPIQTPVEQVPQRSTDNNLFFIFGLVGLAGLSLIILVVYLISTKNKKQKATVLAQPAPSAANPNSANRPKPSNTPNFDDDFKTFINSSGQNTLLVDKEYLTMKSMPGRLIVLNGDQADKSLALFGAQTSDGQVITIGRNSPDWKQHLKSGRENAHIRIQDSTNTLSRLQAEIIYSNGEMKLKNLGQVNPTIVDNKALENGETKTLVNGSTIQAGNLKMRYEV
jgi:hypothetical protein